MNVLKKIRAARQALSNIKASSWFSSEQSEVQAPVLDGLEKMRDQMKAGQPAEQLKSTLQSLYAAKSKLDAYVKQGGELDRVYEASRTNLINQIYTLANKERGYQQLLAAVRNLF